MHGASLPTRQRLALATCLLAGITVLFAALSAQEQAPRQREFEVEFFGYELSPGRIEVTAGDVVRLVITSDGGAHSFTIDEYRISRRIQPGETTVVVFRAGRAGTFAYYCSLTSDARHEAGRGTLVVTER